MSALPPAEQTARIEQQLTQLLMLLQHQTMDIAHLADEVAGVKRTVAAAVNQMQTDVAALRTVQMEQLAALEARLSHTGKRADWFNVQTGELLRVLLQEIRDVRTTQVCAALSDGPLTAQALADLVHTRQLDELMLELPRR